MVFNGDLINKKLNMINVERKKNKIFKKRINEAITFLFENNLMDVYTIKIDKNDFTLKPTEKIGYYEENEIYIDELTFTVFFDSCNQTDYFLDIFIKKIYPDEEGSQIYKTIQIRRIYQDFKKIPFNILLKKIIRTEELFDIQTKDDLKKYFFED